MYRNNSLTNKFFALWLILLVSAGLSYAAGSGTSGKTTHHKSVTTSHSQVAHAKKSSNVRSASSKSTGTKSASSKKGRSSKKSARPRGQQAIDNARAREIQEALIRANYLKGEPSGVWDDETKKALVRFQGDNGWQNKVVPDSRALIKLGLGPNHQNVINPETSGLRVPAAPPAAAVRTGDADSPRLQPGGSAN